jgi:LmbE family N-acetylglucosaminyl deacetylase
MAKRVLTVFAHPDDAECVAGGSLLKWHDEGWEIILGIVTDGDKGSSDPD